METSRRGGLPLASPTRGLALGDPGVRQAAPVADTPKPRQSVAGFCVAVVRPSLSLRAWGLRVGRAAGLRDLARRLITGAAATGLRVGATGGARHPGAPRGVALGGTLAGRCGGTVFSHWSLALSRCDTARHQ